MVNWLGMFISYHIIIHHNMNFRMLYWLRTKMYLMKLNNYTILLYYIKYKFYFNLI